MSTETYQVKGMTCAHCATAVTTEVGALPGVAGVQVDLSSGRVRVSSSAPLDRHAVATAIDEAGYELVTNPPPST